jgi:sigma-B regulation protein RsbU (phosphoserine phosphatase)
MLFALWDDDARTLTVANSGAVQPIICRGGRSTTVRVEGFPLGMFPEAAYDEQVIATEPGDAVVFVSDGILDAENAQGEMYGEERLARVLCGYRDRPAGEIAETILQDVTKFQAGKERFDDETIIVVRVR